ncbi:MAG: DHH family phosphoesterase [Candidatus Cloacimonetes bacterium]|nr:DHH family phosphoesterase [Candidatus Cloacimonadota bacterium]
MDSLRKALMELTQSASPVGILTHINPDGDGFCAALFMAK